MVEGEAILHQRNSFAQSLLGQVTKYRAYNEAARPCKQGLGLLIHTTSNRHLQRPAICLTSCRACSEGLHIKIWVRLISHFDVPYVLIRLLILASNTGRSIDQIRFSIALASYFT